MKFTKSSKTTKSPVIAPFSETLESSIFKEQARILEFPQSKESIVGGSERDFRGIAEALENISSIVVVGYASQGSAQAQNLRDTFAAEGLDITVTVVLRADSDRRAQARSDGFTEKNGTLATPEEALPTADLALMLISDHGLTQDGEYLLGLLPKNAVVCLAHGFYVGYLEATNGHIRPDLTVIGVCPKGLGPSVRSEYQRGGGINVSFAVHQITRGGNMGRTRDLAIGVARAIGAPFVFQTTLKQEWRSDIFGERAILDAGIHAIVEVLYDWKVARGVAPQQAYAETADSLVGAISDTLAAQGLIGLYECLATNDRTLFRIAYDAAYPMFAALMEKIYRDVSSGREILEVVADGIGGDPMLDVSATDIWQTAEKIRKQDGAQTRSDPAIDPITAGIYIAGIVAQSDKLRAEGHAWSEIINETVLEAVESLLPHMQAQGISSMIDSCSVTARRGDRKWAPIIMSRCKLAVLPILDGKHKPESDHFSNFAKNDLHRALQVFGTLQD